MLKGENKLFYQHYNMTQFNINMHKYTYQKYNKIMETTYIIKLTINLWLMVRQYFP